MGGSQRDFPWEQLLNLIEMGRIVPIVGKDLLTLEIAQRRTLLYPYLAELLAQKLTEILESKQGKLKTPLDFRTVSDPLNHLACEFLRHGGEREDIYAALREVMPAAEELPIPEPLLRLASIRPFELFVTTSFDSLLQRALDEVRHGAQQRTTSIAYYPGAGTEVRARKQQLRKPTVFHLFGQLSAVPEYAVTEEDVLEFVHSLQSETQRPKILFDALQEKYLMIIGSGFSEWLARFFIRVTMRERLWGARGRTDFVADARVRDDVGLVVFLERFSGRTKIYPHGGAVEFVEELHRRWLLRHPEQQIREPSPEEVDTEPDRGVVFISYASQDLSAALALKRALEEASIDAWLDEEELGAGDRFRSKIRRTIEHCSLFIPILSRHVLVPDLHRFFRLEWKWAEETAADIPDSASFIVPVVIDGTPPTAGDIPRSFRDLTWEKALEGQYSAPFILRVNELSRKNQQAARRR